MVGWLWLLLFIFLIAAFSVYAYLSTKKALELDKTTKLMKFWSMDSSKSIASSLISIVFGLLIGCIILITITIFPTKGTELTFKSLIDGNEYSTRFGIGVLMDYYMLCVYQ